MADVANGSERTLSVRYVRIVIARQNNPQIAITSRGFSSLQQLHYRRRLSIASAIPCPKPFPAIPLIVFEPTFFPFILRSLSVMRLLAPLFLPPLLQMIVVSN